MGSPRMAMNGKSLLVLCGVLAIGMLPKSAEAQEWRFEPILKAGLVSDDNANLSARLDEEVDLNGYLLEARADIKYSLSNITSFLLQPRVSIKEYPDDSEFDSDDFYLRSTLIHRAQSSTIGFRVNFDQQSVRTAERTESDLEIEDPDEIPDDDTGRVGLDGDRSRWRVSPYWNYQLSNVSSVEATVDYFNTSYDDIIPGTLIDYTDTRLNLNYRRSISSTTNGIITVTGRRYDPDDVILEENNGYGVLGGFERALSPKTRLVAMVGVENTDQAMGQSDTDLIGNVTLTRELETIRLFARYQRAITGNGSGTVELRDTLNMNFNRRLNERISAGLGVRAYQAEQIGEFSTIGDRDYVQLQTQFTWYVTKAFVIEADYRYTVLDRSPAAGVVGVNEQRSNSNEISLWFVYQPKTAPRL